MTLDKKRQDFEDRLDEVEDSKQRSAFSYQRSAGSYQQTAISGQLSEDSTQRLQSWEARLEEMVAEHRRRAGRIIRRRPMAKKPLFSQGKGGLLEWGRDTDKIMLSELELGQLPLPAGFRGGYQVVPSREAMRAAIARACGLGHVPAGVAWKPYQMGVFHVPGRGTLVNPSHYGPGAGGGCRGEGDAHLLAQAVSDLAMERWGWGLLEYTTLGKAAGAAGLWPAMLAHRAGLPAPHPTHTALAETIHHHWLLLKIGWQDWVWQYVMFKAHRPLADTMVDRPRPSRVFELLVRLQRLFPLFISPLGARVRVRALVDLVKFLFLEQAEVAPNLTQQIMDNLHALCREHDERVQELVGLPLSRILGRLYFAWLENQIGILSTPYATLIAAHEPGIDLTKISTSAQFNAYVNQDPRHSPDVRLALLSKLDAKVKFNPRSMATAAWERLKLEGASGFLRDKG